MIEPTESVLFAISAVFYIVVATFVYCLYHIYLGVKFHINSPNTNGE
jgi:hypothetical protein